MRKPRTEAERKASGKFIRDNRKRVGLSQVALADRLRLPQSVISDWETGKLDSWFEYTTELSEVFGVLFEDIAGDTPEDPWWDAAPQVSATTGGPAFGTSPALVRPLQVIREARAGAWLGADEFDQRTQEPSTLGADLRYPKARQWISRVRGDSMNERGLLDGYLVHFFDPADVHYQINTGDIVEVERTRYQRGEIEFSIKEVEVVKDGFLFWPRSSNPRWQQPLELRRETEPEEFTVRISGVALRAVMPLK